MRQSLIAVARLLTLSSIIIVLGGCAIGKRDGLVFNERQSVIMESSILANGIIVERPIVSVENYVTVAKITMSNSQPEPVKVMYRLYWYNDKGLKIATTHDLQQSIPANSMITVSAHSTSSFARNVRIYVFLPQTVGVK